LPGLTTQEMDAWLAFLRSHARIVGQLDRDLINKHRLSLAEYEVLAFLSRSPNGQMRMSRLADSVLISPAALTRRADGLERKGLLIRSRDSKDSRVVLANLTPAGAKRLNLITPTHVEGIRRHFADVLTRKELKEVGQALWKIAGSCDSNQASGHVAPR